MLALWDSTLGIGAPRILKVNLSNIPVDLKGCPQWVTWKAELKEDGKFTKIPINPNAGLNASTRKSESWGTYDDAVHCYQNAKEIDSIGGIGFVFTKDDPFCGVDLDNCYDPATKQTEGWALDILKDLNSYCEISPSNTGIKIFFKGKLPGSGRNFGNIEMYDSGRFFTVTGERVNGYAQNIENRQTEIDALYRKLDQDGKSQPIIVGDSSGTDLLDDMPITYPTKKLIREGEQKGMRSEALMSVMNTLVNAGTSEEMIFKIFDTFPIGEKYREKGASKERWLNKHIEKAKKFTDKKEPEPSSSFPYDLMTGVAGDYANLYGEYLETPKEFLFMSYLTCLGSVLSKRLTLASEINPQPRLYTLLLGQSADDRKSTALKVTIDHYKSALDRRFDVCWGVGSAEGLQRKLTEISDGLILTWDEFKQFVSKCKIQSSVLLPCVNTLFESNRYESRTKTTDINLEDAYLSLLAASTVQTYETTWDSSFTDIGFNNRLFLVPGTAKRRHAFPAKIPESRKNELKSRLNDIILHVGDFKELDIDPLAKGIFESWYMTMEQSIHTKRLDTYAHRFMSLLAVNDFKEIVDVDTVNKL